MALKLQAGRILKLSEVVEQGAMLDGTAVRTLGRLMAYDVASCKAKIIGDGATLIVDTRLLEPFGFKLHSLVQFIGEVDVRADKVPQLVARVARCVDGLDLRLYDEALGLWRQFLEQQNAGDVGEEMEDAS